MPAYLSPGVYIEEKDAGPKPIEAAGTSVAGFVGFTERRPAGNLGEPVLITNWTQFTKEFGGFVPNAFLPLSVYGYFLNGGGICYVQSVLTVEESARKANGNAALPKPTAKLLGRAEGNPVSLEAESRNDSTVTVTITDPTTPGADDQFRVVVRDLNGVEETFDNLTLSRAKGSRNVVDVLNKESKLVKLRELESSLPLAERKPMLGSYTIEAPKTEATALVSTSVFEGDVAARVGLAGLEAVDEITIVAMPDLMSAYLSGQLGREEVKAVQLAMMNHCELMRDRVAIIDALPDMNAQQVNDWRMKEANYDSQYAAMYYPWIYVANPLAGNDGQPSMVKMPPSGHMAGLYARVDAERGVHKAPANEILRGVVKLETQITKGEQDILNPNGINCIRAFPGRGIRVWGARTLSSDPAWRYLNVRRLFCMLEESVYAGIQWAVFEPNDYTLWAKMRRDLNAFLGRIYNTGALFGATADEAFYVKCDAELNPADVRDAGQLFIEIGVSPVKPAEFIVVRFSQMSAPG